MKKEGHKPITKTLLYIGSVIILILAAVSFIVIPAMLPGAQEKLPPLGSYKGKKIEYVQGSYFTEAVAYYDNLQKERMSRENLQNTADGDMLSIFIQAFRDTVMTLAISDEVKKSGYIVPEPLVQRAMLPYFSNSSGTYSAKIFRDTPNNRKIEIRKQVENQLVYSRYSDDISNLKSSNAEIQFIADMNKAARSFDAAFFSTAEYPKEEAAAFGKNNPELFIKYDLSVITLETESEAKKLASRLKNNELVFTDALSEYSTKQYSDDKGALNNKYHYQLKNIVKSEDAFKELTALAQGGISGAIETSSGWSIFMCTGAAENADFADASMANLVYNYMTVYEAGIIEEYFINIAKDFSAQAAVQGFTEAALTYNAQTAEIPPFPINYGNTQLLGSIAFGIIPQLAEAQSNEKFLTTAFSLAEKEISEPLVLGQNIVVLQLKSIETDEKVSSELLQYIYPRYTSQTDAAAVQSFFMASPHLKNNVFDVFFKHFMGN
ncbi:peptidylprolyl isomerase [Treponema sp. OMZ 840]|uniref:peptidylprolyl isomerase n=1 Tax=Treponema sp. OMZ 840 TaxID=244313 RepID=UPI003D8A9231